MARKTARKVEKSEPDAAGHENTSAHDWMKNPKPNEKMGHKAIRWHHGLAQITGGLSLRITKQQFSRAEVQTWIDGMRTIADQMEGMLDETIRTADNPPTDRSEVGSRQRVQPRDADNRKGTKQARAGATRSRVAKKR